ncbi:FAD-dependent oxidoreductase [Streptomyces sp. HNM0663]|uniref:FAD-dependent oxidoreductase n=1 Tax=Streptomyces chengmaiensis TaxID=3040919 RepID=A0ABT6HYN3_9ACTN|nr:FAD-dependent oxidoreductase [Streptomyces chengmaiensis]MDH2393422.1 FAD-dependent oxidoreductase [Streptomyces chengmaiensis]
MNTTRTNATKQRTRQQIVVLGAGYAGLLAALRLAPHAEVILVDPSDRFTERVRLHELAAGRPDVTHPLQQILRGTGVRHLAARATALDPVARQVTTDDGRILPYDRLVYALGSRTGHLPGSPLGPEGGAADERAYSAESAEALRKRLVDGPGSLAVVGGGLTGVEMAAELAEAYPDWSVRLLSAGPLAAGCSGRGRDHIHTVLAARGVRVEEGRRVADAGEVDADAVVWTASMVPNTALAAAAGLALDPEGSGRIAVDASLRSLTHPEVYAAGDAAASHAPAPGRLRMACATALPTGSHAASSILAEARGHTPKPLSFGFTIQCVSLGRHDGLIQFVRPDDSPRDRMLTGRTAARAKEQVVRSTVRFLRLAARRPSVVSLIPGL